MKRLGLNKKVLEKIKADPVLFGMVAKALHVSSLTLPLLLKKNHPKLTQIESLMAIKEYLGVQDKDILCAVQQKEKKVRETKSLVDA